MTIALTSPETPASRYDTSPETPTVQYKSVEFTRPLKVEDDTLELQQTHSQLLLHAPKQSYSLSTKQDIPKVDNEHELLVRITHVGLNPIDWKSPDFSFGIPTLPCINGREFVGKVVKPPKNQRWGCFSCGHRVLVTSTDYRDFRKAAFQEYAIASSFNTVELPQIVDSSRAAGVGVAFVTAAMSLGVSFGVVFPRRDGDSPIDLLSIARSQIRNEVPLDIVSEVFEGITIANRAHAGEWILVMGASSITGQLVIQLAKLAGLHVVAVADMVKHGERLKRLQPDILIDRSNLRHATEEILQSVPGSLRFGVDTVGRETAAFCQEVLARRTAAEVRKSPDRQAVLATDNGPGLSHLVGLTGLPREPNPLVKGHKLPIKLFHTNQQLGNAVSRWMEDLLEQEAIILPEVELMSGGLEAVNPALDRMRKGEASGRRFVVSLELTRGS